MRKKYEIDLTDEQWEDAKSQVRKTRIGNQSVKTTVSVEQTGFDMGKKLRE